MDKNSSRSKSKSSSRARRSRSNSSTTSLRRLLAQTGITPNNNNDSIARKNKSREQYRQQVQNELEQKQLSSEGKTSQQAISVIDYSDDDGKQDIAPIDLTSDNDDNNKTFQRNNHQIQEGTQSDDSESVSVLDFDAKSSEGFTNETIKRNNNMSQIQTIILSDDDDDNNNDELRKLLSNIQQYDEKIGNAILIEKIVNSMKDRENLSNIDIENPTIMKSWHYAIVAIKHLIKLKKNNELANKKIYKRMSPIIITISGVYELATRNHNHFLLMNRLINFVSTLIIGANVYPKQPKNKENKGHSIDYVAATPGRLLTMLNRKDITLDNTRLIILDEHAYFQRSQGPNGLRHQLRDISAFCEGNVKWLGVDTRNILNNKVEHYYLCCHSTQQQLSDVRKIVTKKYKKENILIFCHTKCEVNIYYERLSDEFKRKKDKRKIIKMSRDIGNDKRQDAMKDIMNITTKKDKKYDNFVLITTSVVINSLISDQSYRVLINLTDIQDQDEYKTRASKILFGKIISIVFPKNKDKLIDNIKSVNFKNYANEFEKPY